MAADQSNLHLVLIPNELCFYTDEHLTVRQVFKIYNTYAFPVKFRVLCTSPHKYRVFVPEGLIRPFHHADIAIEMHNRSFEHINRKDVFRVEFRRHHKNNMKTRNGSNDYGTREVGVVLLSGQRPNVDRTADSTTAESSTSTTYTDPSATSSASTSTSTTGGVTCAACPDRAARKDQQFLMRIAIAVALISTLGLMLPLNGDSQSMLPQLLHLSPQFKQVLAFASGLSIGFTLSC